jgi:heterodisulfide reductase subunit D
MVKNMTDVCSWQDLNRCAKCGLCLAHCPVYLDQLTEKSAPRGKIQLAKALEESRLEPSAGVRDTFANCLLCGACHAVCPGGMSADRTVLDIRRKLAHGMGPGESSARMAESIREEHNIAREDNEERAEWLEDLIGEEAGDNPQPEAEALFFVGCVGAFFPSVQIIPQTLIKIFRQTNVSHSVIGGREWCCGFPLLAAGMNDQLQDLIEHNQRLVAELKPKSMVFSCPSCLRMWKTHYQTQIPLYHSSQFIDHLIGQGRIRFKQMSELKVTYHDPCDLGRHGGDYQTPRSILRAIPGITLLEMEKNRDLSCCCGGGGNLEMNNPELSRRLARKKLEMAMETGAETIVTACQQCVRTMAGAAVRQKLPVKVMDLTELVLSALDHGTNVGSQ